MMPQSWLGKTIGGRYKIEALLGQGGMSAVYRGIDPNLRRMVAIKLIHPHLSTDPNFMGRFKEEAATVARLRHPNIVQVYDFNVDGEIYYMVMEYLAGETLQARLKRLKAAQRLMPLSEAVHICTQICEASGYAHKHELVHRDIKPANIMLDLNGQAILMDFGIVKIVGGEYHTTTGATVGTAMYMSPEQIRSERIDDRADIFSLGVTLYEMISGRTPYQADSVATLMMMVLNDPLPDIREIREGVPEDLLAVVEKALAKDPSERFQTMAEMGKALHLTQDKLTRDPLAATVVDEDEIYLPLPLKKERTVKDTALKIEKNEASKPRIKVTPSKLHAQEVKTPDLPTIQDPQIETDTTLPKPDAPGARSVSGLGSRRILLTAVGLLLLIVAGATGYLYINSQKPPVQQLTPINQPPIPVNAQTAQVVVNLGRWEIDSYIEELTYSPDGILLGTANNRNRSLYSKYRFYSSLWRIDTGSHQNYVLEHSQWLYDVAFSPDGELFATASDDASVSLWQVNEGIMARRINGEFGGFTSVDFSPNNMLLAAGSWDGVVGLWQLSNGNLLRTLEGNDDSIRDVTFSPDGQLLASASDDHTILLWRVSDGNLVHTLRDHMAPVYEAVFSPDGTLLASASEDKTIGLWQVNKGNLLRTLQGHTEPVSDVAFSPDGSLLASCSGDGTLRLWRISDGQLLSTLVEHSDSINSVAFSPDGHLLVSGTADGILQFWGISQAIPLETELAPASP
jgi:serine/threonine protein kinase